jgi:hypothetical protein
LLSLVSLTENAVTGKHTPLEEEDGNYKKYRMKIIYFDSWGWMALWWIRRPETSRECKFLALEAVASVD